MYGGRWLVVYTATRRSKCSPPPDASDGVALKGVRNDPRPNPLPVRLLVHLHRDLPAHRRGGPVEVDAMTRFETLLTLIAFATLC